MTAKRLTTFSHNTFFRSKEELFSGIEVGDELFLHKEPNDKTVQIWEKKGEFTKNFLGRCKNVSFFEKYRHTSKIKGVQVVDLRPLTATVTKKAWIGLGLLQLEIEEVPALS